MAQVLSTGLEFLEHSNPNGNPCVKGYNIIDGELKQASDGSTFKSTNPAWLDDCLGEFPLSTEKDVHEALRAARKAFTGWSAIENLHENCCVIPDLIVLIRLESWFSCKMHAKVLHPLFGEECSNSV